MLLLFVPEDFATINERHIFIERLFVTVLAIAVITALYYTGSLLALTTNYTDKSRKYLAAIISGGISLLVFYSYAIVLNVFNVGNKYITAIALLLIPLSLILVVSAALLFAVSLYQRKPK
jgi:hypothetical protein